MLYLFYFIIVFEPTWLLPVYFLQLTQSDPSSLHFDFNPIAASNSSLERSSISDFLVDFIVDCLMCMGT